MLCTQIEIFTRRLDYSYNLCIMQTIGIQGWE